MKFRLKNNYHTHCFYCHHAGGTVEDYIKKAIELGFNEIGMTDHAPVIDNLIEAYGEEYASLASNMSHEDMPKYLKDIDDCKKKYSDKIKIYSGFETEYLPKGIEFYKKLRASCDYLNLGVHYFDFNGKISSPYDAINFNYKTVSYYADACVEGMKTGLYNTLVHPDLFMFYYQNINGERKFDEAAIKASRRIIEASIKYNVYLELNINGLRENSNKPYKTWYYPYYEFWRIVKEYPNAKIIIGADAHSPDRLDADDIRIVKKFADELGLKISDRMEINH